MPLLEVRGLSKYFGGLTAVNDFSFSVEKGDIVGLIGPNGAGKSTVFNTIMGTHAPTAGKVFFKGKEITGRKPYEVVCHGLVRSFQRTALFGELTALQNILLGFHLVSGINLWGCLFSIGGMKKKQNELVEKAGKLADFMGLGERKDQLAKNLSHGYQRLLGVAIALATNPELILMDEPVTGMNPQEKDAMMSKIREIRNRGVTILLVEHDMRLVMNICDRLFVLNFGSKIAQGTPSEILANSEVIAAYLGPEYAPVS